ncbi:MAG: TatD family hydrolase [Breznakia sp.]
MIKNLIDTHAHLTCNRLYPRIDEIVASAKTAGLKRILVVCTNLEEFYRAKKYKEKNDMIRIALGFHPGDVEGVDEQAIQGLLQSIVDRDIIAIGEIGLDYHYEPYDENKQKSLFIKQIQLANKYKLPILIHMRDATKDTLDILKKYAKTKFLMHCFSGSVESANIVQAMGGYLSFAGVITFKNAKGLLNVASTVASHRLFVESDAPYLTPHPFRGKENESKYIVYTFDKIAELKQMEPQKLAEQMEQNFYDFFQVE